MTLLLNLSVELPGDVLTLQTEGEDCVTLIKFVFYYFLGKFYVLVSL